MAVDLHELVRQERTRRGLSIRDAARLARISNTTWGRYEAGDDLTPLMRVAVATAFEWGTDWPENPPALPASDLAALMDAVAVLTERLEALSALRRTDPTADGDGTLATPGGGPDSAPGQPPAQVVPDQATIEQRLSALERAVALLWDVGSGGQPSPSSPAPSAAPPELPRSQVSDHEELTQP